MSDETKQSLAPVPATTPLNQQATTALVGIDANELVAAGFDERDYANFAGGIEFLPRLQLCGASTDLCKEGKQPIGTYAIVKDKDNYTDLGKQCNLFVCGLRLKALEIIQGPEGGVYNFFDPKSEEFKRVANLSNEKDTGCLAGPEFLVYIPATKQFATFFMASKSMRNEAPSVKALLGKAASLTVALAENKKKQKWHVTKALPCTIPLDVPPPEELSAQLLRFRNPVSSNVRRAPVTTTAGAVGTAPARPQ